MSNTEQNTASLGVNINTTAGNDTINKPQCAVLFAVFAIAAKTGFLPAILSEISNESSVWVILIMMLLDAVCAFAAVFVAKQGGIQSHALPSVARKIFSALFLVLFLFKFCAYSFEAAMTASVVLFEDTVTIPLLLLFLVGVCVISAKGFIGIGRTAQLLAWGAIGLFIFNLFFVGLDGHDFNLFPLLQPQGIAKGMLKCAVWFGDFSVLITTDLSRTPKSLKQKDRGGLAMWLTYVLSAGYLIAFYVLLIYTYGGSASMVDNAFARLFIMNEKALELGALDWPIIIIWLMMAVVAACCMLCGSRQCYTELFERSKKTTRLKTIIFYILAMLLPVVFYYTVFENKAKYIKVLTSLPVGICALVLLYLLPLSVAICMLVYKKKKEKEVPIEEQTQP